MKKIMYRYTNIINSGYKYVFSSSALKLRLWLITLWQHNMFLQFYDDYDEWLYER